MVDEFEETLTKWYEEDSKVFNINEGLITKDDRFDIISVIIISFPSTSIVVEIINLLKKLMKEHNNDIAKISKAITISLKNQEKYFALYVLGKNFNKTSKNEQIVYMHNIARELDVSEKELRNVLYYLDFLIDLEKGNQEPVSETITRIVASEFKENEVDCMILLRGLLPK